MKKIIDFIKSPKSDLILFFLLVLFANLVSTKSFARLDLTSPKSYSLSQKSKQVVKTLEEPLSVKVFFTENLPAPYSTVYQYIKDILVEYKGSANKNFSYEFADMKKPENENLARSYGISQVQIQELKNYEVGFKQAWMGLAIIYADRIEALNQLTSSDGLEYKITAKIEEMVSTTSALAGLSGNAKLTLYLSDSLSKFKIIGFSDLSSEIQKIFSEVNKKNLKRLEFARIDPSEAEIPSLSEKYGIQVLNWKDENGLEHSGVIGLVLEYGEKFNLLSIKMGRDLFGRNMIVGDDDLESDLEDSLKSLVSKSEEIGYITGHGELDISDSKNGAGMFEKLVSDRYTFKEIDLKNEEIPSSLASIVIDGPKSSFSDEELYKIDQYLLRGGNILLFADSFDEKIPEGEMAYYMQPTYEPVSTNLEKNLEKYGISLGKNYVMDKSCFSRNAQNYGKVNFYFAPLLQKSGLSQKNPITKNLGYVIMIQNSSVDILYDEKSKKNSDLNFTVLAKSSPESWTVEKDISTNPLSISVPADSSKFKSENLAVLVEGKFNSAFDSAPKTVLENDSANENENKISGNGDVANAGSENLSSKTHLSKSVQNGKLLVISSSKLTTSQLLDENGSEPVSLFVRNAVDYLNGESDLCEMRTKGLSLNVLSVKSPQAATAAKYFNEIGLAILVAVAGLLVLVKIRARKRAIRAKYNPNDERVIEK
ncbi:MAG: Gldg family protein [Treponema sp.]|nr:Gldg family protein [Treponema sp.]